jgi:hypothetical protein
MKTIAIPLVACALAAATIPLAATASAVCYSADCVPNVTRGVAQGGPCNPSKYFAFGLDAGGATFVCNTSGVWAPVGPLIGVYDVALACPGVNLSAQESTGVPVVCANMNGVSMRWVHRPDTIN